MNLQKRGGVKKYENFVDVLNGSPSKAMPEKACDCESIYFVL